MPSIRLSDDDPRPANVPVPTDIQDAAKACEDRHEAAAYARYVACYRLLSEEKGALARARSMARAAETLTSMSNEDFDALRAEAAAAHARFREYWAAVDAWYARRRATLAAREDSQKPV